jgi:hypothetical protein
LGLVLALLLPPAGAAELRLATWNIEHLAAADGAGCRPRDEADYRRLRDVAERMDAHHRRAGGAERRCPGAGCSTATATTWSSPPAARTGRDTCRGMGISAAPPSAPASPSRREALRAQGVDYRVLPGFRALGVDGRRWGTRILLESASDAEQRWN